ncbi:hypothetical protein EVJ58_g9705 [Rhodofomes roseus]|uniref:Uncharacterized protein n=1 Tax=Rhodofomes roseus TaxID=34475 RepID=A0A4Y9XU75_9APHY|nr:hypothetical protein EVJ58_g9705 [Rhodofomes roseus]
MDATYPSAGSDEYANKAAQTNDDGVIHDESAYVVALQPPAPASAHERAAWRIHDETVSGNLGVVPGRPQAPQLEGLSVITTLDRASVTAESDYHDGSIFGDWTSESSSLPSPNTSTPGLLHTPVDSPTQSLPVENAQHRPIALLGRIAVVMQRLRCSNCHREASSHNHLRNHKVIQFELISKKKKKKTLGRHMSFLSTLAMGAQDLMRHLYLGTVSC